MGLETGFILKLDLSSYFEDLRKYSNVFVDSSKFKIVRDIEKHIKTLFNLEDNICLLNDKFLIPKFEDVQIVQHCDVLRVRKCNFFDEQIHKDSPPKRPCEQTAVNLIQPEKTIDLSCRPKQRLKLNTSQDNCCSSTPKTITYSTNGKKRRVENDDEKSEIKSNIEEQNHKERPRCHKKKHKYANCTEDRHSDVGIIDMSFNKTNKRSHDNCFVTSEDLSEDLDEQLNSNDQRFLETLPKLNRRKKHRQTDYRNETHAYQMESDLKNKKTKLLEKHNKDVEVEYMNGSTLDESIHRQQHMITNLQGDNFSTNEKRKKNRKSIEQTSDKYQRSSGNVCNSNEYYNQEESFLDKDHQKGCEEKIVLDKSDRIYKNNINELKKKCQEHIDSLLVGLEPQTQENTSHLKQNGGESIDKDTYEHSKNYPSSQINCGDYFLREDLSTQSSVNSQAKLKRKRKHAKKKKREAKYLSAVGPTLNEALAQIVCQPSPAPSDVTKHIFFPDEDFAEDTPTPLLKKIDEKADHSNNCDVSKNVGELDNSRDIKTPNGAASFTWQQQLLKLASSSSKPVVFHRNASSNPKIKTETNTRPIEIGSQNLIMNKKEVENKSEISETKSADLEVTKAIENEIGMGNVDINNSHTETLECTDGKEDVEDKNMSVETDLESINLSNYPIINKVVDGDIIIFKILKLSEKFQPEVSKSVLAKVIDGKRFPETIIFDIIGGSDYKDDMKNDRGLIIELKWMDLIEPRLFYP